MKAGPAQTADPFAAAPQEPVTRRAVSRRRMPGALTALLAVTLLLGITWALVVPAFQAPDENSHYGYVQSLVDGPGLPGKPGRLPYSTEQTLAAGDSNADQAAAQPTVKMEWSRQVYLRWKAQEAALPPGARSDGGGANPAAGNPPLYYLYEAVAYSIGGDPFDRLLQTRIASVLWLLVTVTAVWLLAGEVTGRDRLLQLAAASLAGLAPMMTFISASVTPDSMMYALWSLTLWLGVRVLKRGLDWRMALALFGVVGAACVVKGTSYGLIPGALVALGGGLWRRRPLRLGPVVAALGSALVALVLTLGVWKLVANGADRPASAQLAAATSTAGFNPRMLLSYLWQFYLPRLPFQSDFAFLGNTLPAYDIWLKGVWGSFGWLEVRFPSPLYLGLTALTLAFAVLAGITLWRTRRTIDWLVAAFVLTISVVLFIGLHWTEYQQIHAGAGPINQGRYLLPLVGVAGLVVAQGLRRFAPRHRVYAVGTVVGGLMGLQFVALGLLLERYFA